MEKAAGNQHLQLTEETWTNNTNLPPSTKKYNIQIVANDELPLLDMNINWYPEGDLKFGVFSKKR